MCLVAFLVAVLGVGTVAQAPAWAATEFGEVTWEWVEPRAGDVVDGDTLHITANNGTTSKARLTFYIDDPDDEAGNWDKWQVQIRIPYKVWHKRGDPDTAYGLVDIVNIPRKGSAGSESNQWVYSLDETNGVLVLENPKSLPKRSGHIIEMFFKVEGSLSEYVDQTKSGPIVATISTPDGSRQTEALYADINTSAHAGCNVESKFSSKQFAYDEVVSHEDQTFTVSASLYSDSSATQPMVFDNDATLTLLGDGPPATITGATVPANHPGSPTAQIIDGKSIKLHSDAETVAYWSITFTLKFDAADIPTDASGSYARNARLESVAIPIDRLDSQGDAISCSGQYGYAGNYNWSTGNPPPEPDEELDWVVPYGFGVGGYKSSTSTFSNATGKKYAGTYLLDENMDYEQSWLVNTPQKFAVGADTRGVLPEVSISPGDGGGYVVTARNTDTELGTRYTNVEVPLPEGVSLSGTPEFAMNGETVEGTYSVTDSGGVLVEIPNIHTGGEYTVTIPVSRTAQYGLLVPEHVGYRMDGARRIDTFTVTNTGTTPAYIPLEFTRVGFGTGSFEDRWYSGVHYNIYAASINGVPTEVENSTTRRGVAHTVYLPELGPGDIFTYEITTAPNSRFSRDDLAIDKGLTTQLETSFRMKLGSSLLSTIPKHSVNSSENVYFMLSDQQRDYQHNYGLREKGYVYEVRDDGMKMQKSGYPDNPLVTLEPHTDYEIFGFLLDTGRYPKVTLWPFPDERHWGTGSSITPWGGSGRVDYSGEVEYWGRNSEDEQWVRYAKVTVEPTGQCPETVGTSFPTETGSSSSWKQCERIVEIAPYNGATLDETGTYGGTALMLPEPVAYVRATTISSSPIVPSLQMEPLTRVKMSSQTVRDYFQKLADYNFATTQVNTALYLNIGNDSSTVAYRVSDSVQDYQTVPERHRKATSSPYKQFTFANALYAQTWGFTRWGFSNGGYNGDHKVFRLNNSVDVYQTFSDGSYGINSRGHLCVYDALENKGKIAHMKGATLYSLQAPGVRVDKKSVALSGDTSVYGGKITNVKVVNNWRGSGRQMLIVTIEDLKTRDIPTPTCDDLQNMALSGNQGTFESLSVVWTSYYPWVDWISFKKNNGPLIRYEAFEIDTDNYRENEQTGEREEFFRTYLQAETRGNPLEWDTSVRQINESLAGRDVSGWSGDVGRWMDDLNPDHDNPVFVYIAPYSLSLNTNESAAAFYKVEVAGPDVPRYVSKPDVVWVDAGEEYSYRLAYSPHNTQGLNETSIILADKLEEYKLTPEDNTPPENDYDTLKNKKRFQGKIASVNVSNLVARGIEPTVYVSEDTDVDVSNVRASDLEPRRGTNTWEKVPIEDLSDYDYSEVVAVAIDCSYTDIENKDPFILAPFDFIEAIIHMEAPSRSEASKLLSVDEPVAYTFNNAYFTAETINNYDDKTQIKESNKYTKVALYTGAIGPRATKELVDEDGKRLI